MSDRSDARTKWKETISRAEGGLEQLRRAAGEDGGESVCVKGSRAMCWKILLLFESTDTAVWVDRSRAFRKEYDELREKYLRYFTHPEELNQITADPLDDDPQSPWKMYRDDLLLRSEIQQDVERLPECGHYQDESFQALLVDALFVYCKLHPETGYRQGMHELLAPILDVLYRETVERGDEDELMDEMMDAAYLVHDAFALFSRVMRSAHGFYAVGGQVESSAIVEKSRFIHETCLARVDPELAQHLTDVEVLPQIFLIRWVRLLFGREFPFEDTLALWDKMFAVDPDLELVDYICVAMLIRIRWSLLESDYSHCLQLLLKYPAPSKDHGPHTFVDDAIYLKANASTSAGSALIEKYTGKAPAEFTSEASLHEQQPQKTPEEPEKPTRPPRPLIARSPLSSPSKFIKQQGGMEAIFQGAARNVLERGEKLGINRAVRDAVGEIRKNVQGFSEARQALVDGSASSRAFDALERRNRLLAGMLDESIVSLKAIAGADLGDRAKTLELVEMVAARVQFVKVHLEDSSITVDADPLEQPEQLEQPKVEEATEPVKDKDQDVPAVKTTPASPPLEPIAEPSKDTDTSPPPPPVEKRPAPIPTRSTLAQSSFSWMLEPDETAPPPTPRATSSAANPSSPGKTRTKRNPGAPGLSRERNAFLFGEDDADASLQPEDIFGMEPIARKDGRGGAKELF
ncbi:WD repeat domain-containing protein [Plectosphaerella plurivora]|uniref:WD repeat domain-containing protein n=1 Tax=Plectosphaerella plurivora TaxID=936078 RepID=A0A9P8VBR6_9PEZI|nr:WD repeat domain-containing protein [Plectosphaerella plurivora]